MCKMLSLTQFVDTDMTDATVNYLASSPLKCVV